MYGEGTGRHRRTDTPPPATPGPLPRPARREPTCKGPSWGGPTSREVDVTCWSGARKRSPAPCREKKKKKREVNNIGTGQIGANEVHFSVELGRILGSKCVQGPGPSVRMPSSNRVLRLSPSEGTTTTTRSLPCPAPGLRWFPRGRRPRGHSSESSSWWSSRRTSS